jgi:NarL family two-component system response regulator LiaR
MAEAEDIRILVVDDHTMVRTGLATFLKVTSGLELVGEAKDGEMALSLCAQYQPDVVLMDLVLPRMDGVEATREIRQRWPHIQVIALTSFQEEKLVQQALQAGAISYLLKDVSMDELAQAIRSAYAGRSVLAPEAAQALIQATRKKPDPSYNLTARELEVMKLMVDGLTNPQIGEALTISVTTARSHVSSILTKLGVSNRSEAVALALRQHLVE